MNVFYKWNRIYVINKIGKKKTNIKGKCGGSGDGSRSAVKWIPYAVYEYSEMFQFRNFNEFAAREADYNSMFFG